MNSAVAFLLVAVAVSVLGSIVLWLRHRKPTGFSSSIDEFQREMAALAREPEIADRPRRRRRRRRREAPAPIVPATHDPELAQKLRSARRRIGADEG